jgi:outer membrane protein OmpA-like peptidoglycan-associated protein
LLSPAVYAQRFSTELVNKADKSPLSGKKTDDWNFGVGGDLSLRYKISRAFDVQLRTGIIWVNNNKMDGVSTLIKSKDHFMTSAGLSLIWKVGKKKQDNVLYASKHVTDIAVRYIEERAVNLPTPVCCTEDSIEKNRMKQKIASLNMQLQQAQTDAKERVESNPVLGFNELPPVYFKRGSAYLNVALYKNELSRIVETLKKYPDLKVILLGYADHTGNPDINQKISLQRAEVLATYLEKKGIDSKRINVKGECIDTLTSDPNNYSVLARRVIVEIQK